MKTLFIAWIRFGQFVTGLFIVCSTAGNLDAANYPLKVGPTQRYLVDQVDAPFLVHADSPWSLIIALNQNEVIQYLQDRKQKGFNALLVNLIEQRRPGADNPFLAPTNRYGQAPFLTPGDFSTPNESYFTNADWVIDQAATNGMVVVLFPCYLGFPFQSPPKGWYDDMVANGAAKCRAYGRYVGSRYANKPNIIWGMYGDHNPDGTIQPLEDEMVAGIQETDTNHLFTAHLQRNYDVRSQVPSSWLKVNTSYTGFLTYIGCLSAYAVNPVMPFFQIENYYDGEHDSTPFDTRSQAYWANLSGACGQTYGNYPIWLFEAGWQSALNSPRADDMTRVRALFESRPWTKLVPDSTHLTLTAGYGTFGDSTYVTAALASDGSTMMAYLPIGGTVTVNLTKLSGSQAQAWWYNPRTGANSNAGVYSTVGSHDFQAPDSNDWVLVLDDDSRQFPPPGTVPPPPLAVATTNLANGSVGAPYSTQLTASGGTPPYAWSVVSRVLPTGLTLSQLGLLSGTPSIFGTASLVVRVTDASSVTADKTLTLTVGAGNAPPTISVMGSQVINAGTDTGIITFTIGDNETSAGSLVVTGGSSNPTLVPTNNIVFGGSGSNRTVTVIPAQRQAGTAIITVRVSDGELTANTTFGLTVFAAQPIGLVAAYSFEEGAGLTTMDVSGHGNKGSLQGAVWTAAGRFGGALSFDGSSRVAIEDSNYLDLTNGFTLEAWVFPTAAGTDWATVLFKEQFGGLAYALYSASPADRPSVYVYTTGEHGFSGPSALSINTWSHLSATYDGAVILFYVNGILVGSQPLSGNVLTSSSQLSIGGNAVWGEYFRGMIDEVRIYNRALSGAEIQIDMGRAIGTAAVFSLTPAPVVGLSSFKFLLGADSTGLCTVEYSTNLASWISLSTVQFTNGQVEVIDASAGLSPQRFYRVRQP